MNLDHLKSLLGDDDTLVNQFLKIFKEETPNQLNALKSSAEQASWSEASILAHSIKSQLKYLSLNELAQLAYTIETNCEKQKDLDDIQNQIDRLYKGVHASILNL